jgi:hypothetical protein
MDSTRLHLVLFRRDWPAPAPECLRETGHKPFGLVGDRVDIIVMITWDRADVSLVAFASCRDFFEPFRCVLIFVVLPGV